MTGFALFRQPFEQQCTLVSGTVSELSSYEQLDGCQGFVMAPFAPSPTQPVLLIHPDKISFTDDGDQLLDHVSMGLLTDSHDDRIDYQHDFQHFHACLMDGSFQKLVLSRSLSMVYHMPPSPLSLFRRACACYPRMFISLVYTPKSGLWLTSTPEILLSGSGQQWQTIALAGTMQYEENLRWSEKNIQEQRYVASYIIQQLEPFTRHIPEEGPRTARAGHLAHLRSDFHFTLSHQAPIGQLLAALHPTPAVCGLPKQEAFRFILQNEHHQRSYYSGFMGPLSLNGMTSVFVTLRCMRLFQNGYRLYAGGGLLKDSVEEQEWLETETKMDTMRHIIYHHV